MQDGVYPLSILHGSQWPPLSSQHPVEPSKNRPGFVQKRIKKYLKWHITAILDYKIILTCRITSGSTNDSPVLRTMLRRMKKLGMSCRDSIFCADRGYDSDESCKMIFGMGMIPNIKQRWGATNRGKPFRRRAAALFDESIYRYRGLIEGIFGPRRRRGTAYIAGFRKAQTRRDSAI